MKAGGGSRATWQSCCEINQFLNLFDVPAGQGAGGGCASAVAGLAAILRLKRARHLDEPLRHGVADCAAGLDRGLPAGGGFLDLLRTILSQERCYNALTLHYPAQEQPAGLYSELAIQMLQDAGLAMAYGDYVDLPTPQRVAALSGLTVLALTGARIRDLLAQYAEDWPAPAKATPPAAAAQQVLSLPSLCWPLRWHGVTTSPSQGWEARTDRDSTHANTNECAGLLTVCMIVAAGSPSRKWPGRTRSSWWRPAGSHSHTSTTAATTNILRCAVSRSLLHMLHDLLQRRFAMLLCTTLQRRLSQCPTGMMCRPCCRMAALA